MRKLFISFISLFFAWFAQAQSQPLNAEAFGIDPNVSYSGTRHMQTKDGQMEMFVRQAPGKSRMEMQIGEYSSIIITREDKGVNYTLMPAMNTYMVIDAKKVQEAGGANVNFSDQSKVGRETVNGFECNKYRAKFSDARGGKGGGYYWVSDDGIVIKTDMIYKSRKQKGQRMVFEMRDVQVAAQDPAYFEVPSSYSKMGIGSMMKQARAQQNPNGAKGQPDAQEPDILSEAGTAAKQETKQGVLNETRNAVRKGFGKIFNRN